MSKNPVEGLPLHTRSLTVAVSRESDDRWHARGDVIDLRKNGFVPSSYDLQPSGIIHSMNIELAFDPATLEIGRVAVDQPFVAIEPSPATDGECCRDPAPRLLDFEGDRLDDGFAKRLGLHFGGALGCSHLLTLFQLMASTIPRAVRLEQERAEREGTRAAPGERFFRRSVFVDGNERSDSLVDATVQLADTQTRPLAEGDRVTERLELSHEVKLFVSVDRKRFLVERMSARERTRRFDSLSDAAWTSHDERIAPLVGVRLIPGMAGRVFGLLGGEDSLRPLRDALLQLAPGYIQITAALMDEYFERRSPESAGASTEKGARASTEKPAVASLGGNTNSCYMWREGGKVARAWGGGRAG